MKIKINLDGLNRLKDAVSKKIDKKIEDKVIEEQEEKKDPARDIVFNEIREAIINMDSLSYNNSQFSVTDDLKHDLLIDLNSLYKSDTNQKIVAKSLNRNKPVFYRLEYKDGTIYLTCEKYNEMIAQDSYEYYSDLDQIVYLYGTVVKNMNMSPVMLK